MDENNIKTDINNTLDTIRQDLEELILKVKNHEGFIFESVFNDEVLFNLEEIKNLTVRVKENLN